MSSVENRIEWNVEETDMHNMARFNEYRML